MSALARLVRRWSRRTDSSSHVADDRTRITQVFRNPRQMAVLAKLLRTQHRERLRVAIYGVADGAEAVSLLVALDPAGAHDVRIDGFDINQEYLSFAKALSFPRNHFAPGHDPASYPHYFQRLETGDWQLAPIWHDSIAIAYGDVLALPRDQHGAYDAVLCQNVLVSLATDDRIRAFRDLTALVRPGGLLVAGGGPLDRIAPLARSCGLIPVLDDVEAIHEGWVVQRAFYANAKPPYWALEPFDAAHPDGVERFATIFRKPASSDAGASHV